MKRFLLIVTVMLSLLLYGCQTADSTDTSDYKNSFSKAQEIAVVSADTSEITESITAREDIDDFVLALEIENWESEPLPDTASEVGTFKFLQEKTKKIGQTDPDETLSNIAAITVYDSPYVCLEFCGLDMVFEVSPDTVDYLQRYFK